MKTETFIKWLTAEFCAVAGLLWGDLDGMISLLTQLGWHVCTPSNAFAIKST